MYTGQSDRENSLIEIHSSQVTLVCVKLIKKKKLVNTDGEKNSDKWDPSLLKDFHWGNQHLQPEPISET